MTTQNHIQAPSTHPGLRAQRRLRDRGDELLADLAMHVELATELQLPLADREPARDGLIDFCRWRVVGHLLAHDRVLYAVAAGAIETRLLARALRAQHELMAARMAELMRADSSSQIADSAHALLSLLQVGHHIEQQVLIPALAELPGVDLAALLEDIDTLLAGNALDVPDELDVSRVPRPRRHPRIFRAYGRLAPGESFILINNHDPKPLRHELQATYPDQFGWDYLEAGPDRWRVRIGRPAVGT